MSNQTQTNQKNKKINQVFLKKITGEKIGWEEAVLEKV